MTRTDADKPLRRARHRHAAIRTLRWLAFGTLVSFATGWGCILWRVYVAFNWTPASGQTVPMTEWPFEFGETWSLPTACERAMGMGYRKIQANDSRVLTDDHIWINFEQVSAEYAAATQRAFDALQTSGSKESTEILRGANLRYANARNRITYCMFFQRQSGWPLRCMESRYVARTSPLSSSTAFIIGEEFSPIGSARASWQQLYNRGLLWPAAWAPPSGTTFTLPLRPVWPRFALNTLIWAAIGCTASVAIAARRRRNRRLAGECIQCRYQIAGLAVCPECGTPVDASATDVMKVQAD